MGFVVIHPRQLAPTVGKKQVGSMVSAVPSPAIDNPATSTTTLDDSDGVDSVRLPRLRRASSDPAVDLCRSARRRGSDVQGLSHLRQPLGHSPPHGSSPVATRKAKIYTNNNVGADPTRCRISKIRSTRPRSDRHRRLCLPPPGGHHQPHQLQRRR